MSLRRRPKFIGLFHDDVVTDSYWIREEGRLALPPLRGIKQLVLVGEVLPPAPDNPAAAGNLGLVVRLDGVQLNAAPPPPGPLQLTCALPGSDSTTGHVLALTLTGVAGSNLLAWLGRVTGLASLQRWRAQARNRRLRIAQGLGGGGGVFVFGKSPL